MNNKILCLLISLLLLITCLSTQVLAVQEESPAEATPAMEPTTAETVSETTALPDIEPVEVTDNNADKTAVVSGNWEYSLSEGNAIITVCNLTGSYISVPSTIDGYTVVGIGNNVFKNNTTLTSVSLPSSLESIGSSAFSGCTKLKSITLPKKLETIGQHAFYDCKGLEYILVCSQQLDDLPSSGNVFNESNTFYNAGKNVEGGIIVEFADTVTKIPARMFVSNAENYTRIKEVIIGKNVTNIGANAFKNCYDLEVVAISNNSELTNIGSSAFSSCTKLKNIILPKKLETIGQHAFYNCKGLEHILVYSQQLNDLPNSGNVFNESNTFYDAGKNVEGGIIVEFADTVTKIPARMFVSNAENYTRIKEVIIGKNVTNIGANAFKNCTDLQIIRFCGNAPSITSNAFYKVTADAYYPSGNATWTSSVKKDYGGSIVWKSYKPTPDYNGLTLVDGIWGYYIDGVLQLDYYGLVQYAGNWYYVQGGIVTWKHTGLVQYYGNWYYVENSEVNWNYTGMVQHGGNWYVVEGGMITWTYTGLIQYYGNWFYSENSEIRWDYTGMVQHGGNWYVVESGMITWTYTGLIQYYGNWFYAENSEIRWDYTGMVQHGGNWYVVESGMITWTYTGLIKYYGNYYYSENSEINWHYVGLTNYKGNWIYVVNGEPAWNFTGLIYHEGHSYYIEGGMITWTYTGIAPFNGKQYYVVNSKIAWNYTGDVYYNGVWYYVVNGVVQ